MGNRLCRRGACTLGFPSWGLASAPPPWVRRDRSSLSAGTWPAHRCWMRRCGRSTFNVRQKGGVLSRDGYRHCSHPHNTSNATQPDERAGRDCACTRHSGEPPGRVTSQPSLRPGSPGQRASGGCFQLLTVRDVPAPMRLGAAMSSDVEGRIHFPCVQRSRSMGSQGRRRQQCSLWGTSAFSISAMPGMIGEPDIYIEGHRHCAQRSDALRKKCRSAQQGTAGFDPKRLLPKWSGSYSNRTVSK